MTYLKGLEKLSLYENHFKALGNCVVHCFKIQ